jgi:conjugative relaxase-like TrwC/TraI family protein
MLSGDFLSSAEGGEQYFYGRDNYYLNDIEDEGYWRGGLAEILKLSGKVEKEVFTDLLRGLHRIGQNSIAISSNAGESTRRVGCDLTFSAPKSVSILAYKDKRIQAAFDSALHKSLEYIERNFVQTRHRKKKEMSYEMTGNAAFAIFCHHTSRELDPQLHAHCVMPNITFDPKGKKSPYMCIHNVIYENKHHIGQYFRNELAQELQKLDYRIEVTDPQNGLFEIKGVSDEIIANFSKRAEQVKTEVKRLRGLSFKKMYESKELSESQLKKWAEERINASGGRTNYQERLKKEIEALKTSNDEVYAGKGDAELAVLAVKNSRKPKKGVTKDYIIEQINNTLKCHGETLDSLVDKAKTEPPASVPSNPHTPETAILAVVDGITRTEVAFTQEDLTCRAMKLTMGKISPDEIIAEFDRLVETGKIVYLRKETTPKKGDIYIYSTPELKHIEAENLKICQNSETGIRIDSQEANEFIDQEEQKLVRKSEDGVGFLPGQKAALRHILTTKSQFSVIQGDAGTGKSFAMLYAKKLLETHGYNVRGLAPTGKAADELFNAAQITDSSTIHKLIHKQEDYNFEKGKECIIVDEASMCDSWTINKLLKIVKEYDAKIIFVGDRKQFAPIGAGKFFADLQDKTDVDIIIMKDVVRQKTDQTKETVKSISAKNYDVAFNLLRGYRPVKMDKSKAKNYSIGQILSFNQDSIDVPGGGNAQITAVGKSSLTIKYNSYGRDFEIEITPQKAHRTYTVYSPDNAYKSCIDVIKDRDARLEAVAKDYVNCYNNGTNALVITATNDDRRSLNDRVRSTLVEQGKIENIGKFTLLEPQNINKFEIADSFEVGQRIKGLPQLKVDNKYEYGEIIDIDKNQNRLKIRSLKTNEEFSIDPSRYTKKPFSVFTKSSATLGINERVTFLKNARLIDGDTGKTVNVRNGQLATITKLDNNGDISVETDNGKNIKFNLSEYNLLTHAYALSSHKSQGMTVDKIIWHADTNKEISTNSFYVAVTRCKYDIAIYTDDIEKLQKKARREQEKYSTIDDNLEYRYPDNTESPDDVYDISSEPLSDSEIEKMADNSYADMFEFGQHLQRKEHEKAEEQKRQEKLQGIVKKVTNGSDINWKLLATYQIPREYYKSVDSVNTLVKSLGVVLDTEYLDRSVKQTKLAMQAQDVSYSQDLREAARDVLAIACLKNMRQEVCVNTELMADRKDIRVADKQYKVLRERKSNGVGKAVVCKSSDPKVDGYFVFDVMGNSDGSPTYIQRRETETREISVKMPKLESVGDGTVNMRPVKTEKGSNVYVQKLDAKKQPIKINIQKDSKTNKPKIFNNLKDAENAMNAKYDAEIMKMAIGMPEYAENREKRTDKKIEKERLDMLKGQGLATVSDSLPRWSSLTQ